MKEKDFWMHETLLDPRLRASAGMTENRIKVDSTTDS
jgi:hypothetical protein